MVTKSIMARKIKEAIIEITAEKKRFMSTEEIIKELKNKKINISRPTIKKYIDEIVKEGWLQEDK